MIKEYETKSLKEIAAAPPRALQGLAGWRVPSPPASNLPLACSVCWCSPQLCGCRPRARGTRPDVARAMHGGARLRRADDDLAALGVKTVGDLSRWKYLMWADALVALSKAEKDDFTSQ